MEGLLYQVSCHVENTGNQLVKNEYLRFSFPTGSTVLDTFQEREAPQELQVLEVPLDKSTQTDRRWKLGHLERGQEAQFGFLVSGPTAAPPEIHGYNETGGVELAPRQAAVSADDASHVAPLVTLLLLGWLLPAFGNLWFGALITQGASLIIAILAIPHLAPFARVVRRRLERENASAPVAEVAIQGAQGRTYVATRGAVIQLPADDQISA